MTTSTGSQDGTASYAGGGFGGWSLFGQAGIGGNGVATSDSNGRNAANFGGGGGGGGGSTTGFGKGGSGSDGFVRIRYKVIE